MSVLQLSVATVVLAGTLACTLVVIRSHQRQHRARHRAPDSTLRTAAAVTPVVSIALFTAMTSSSSRADASNRPLPISVELAQAPSTGPTGIPVVADPIPLPHTARLLPLSAARSASAGPVAPAQHTLPPRTPHSSRAGSQRLRLIVPPAVTATFRQRVVRAVQDVLGTPYRYGAESPADGFDCSGLTMWAYSRAGIRLPRIADEQMHSMQSVRIPTPGDLVFFLDGGGHAYHAGVYVAPGQMIAAPKTGDHVRVETIWTASISYRAAV